jgi:glucose uptake protein
LFALGVFLTTPVFGIFFMNLPVEGDPVDIPTFLSSTFKQHLLGFTGGIIWLTGTLAGTVAVSVPENLQGAPVPSYLLAQCWPLLAALWGIVVFRDLKGADSRVGILAVLMLVLYLCGLGMIAMAPVYMIAKP